MPVVSARSISNRVCIFQSATRRPHPALIGSGPRHADGRYSNTRPLHLRPPGPVTATIRGQSLVALGTGLFVEGFAVCWRRCVAAGRRCAGDVLSGETETADHAIFSAAAWFVAISLVPTRLKIVLRYTSDQQHLLLPMGCCDGQSWSITLFATTNIMSLLPHSA